MKLSFVKWPKMWGDWPPMLAPVVDVEIEYLEEKLFGFKVITANPWFVTTA